MMKMLLKSCFSVLSLDFHRFYRHVLTWSPGNDGFCLVLSTHIFASTSRQSAGIALKTSPIESYQFSASKLCTNFFPTPTKNYFFSRSKIFFGKKSAKNIFRWNSWKNLKFRFFETYLEFQIFSGFHQKIFWSIFFSKFIFDSKKT